MLSAEQVELVKAWHNAKVALGKAEAYEKELRLKVASEVFDLGEGELMRGTHRHDVEETQHGMIKVKMVGRLNYNLDQKKVDETLNQIEDFSPEGKFIADRLVGCKFSLSVSEYEKAPEWARKYINRILTIKPGLPQIEVEFPKEPSK